MELTGYRAEYVTGYVTGEVDELQDARDIALCEAIKARGEAGVPHDIFMASVGP
jgi:hypothetical protein